ncbi:tyrosine-type recombinase/integrase [Ruminococcaceae bacterium OttesenSCG-928-D13]|nr:tyrosine-type recombinase/integrase [Ruminococcaceae bacterium OttesenSCG-928-D13]
MNCIKCRVELLPESIYCHICGKKQVVEKSQRKPRTRGNGEGTAFQRGKTWTCEVNLGKKRNPETGKIVTDRRTKGGFKTKREALEYIPTLKAQKDAEITKPVSTLGDMWDIYSTNAMLKLSDSKQKAYRLAHKRLADLIDTPINAITIQMLQHVVDEQAPTFYPAKDIKNLLSHLYKRAMAQQEVAVNLSDFIELPEMEENEPVPFNEDELKKIWASYGEGDKFAGYILLMIYSGMMPGELLNVRKDKIDWLNQRIEGCGLKTKKRKEVPIVIANLVVPVLHDLCSLTDSDMLLEKSSYRSFSRAYRATLERCGVEHHNPYACRHTTATALALGNVAPEVIKEVMRHAKIDTTKRYIHKGVDTKPMLDAVNTLK